MITRRNFLRFSTAAAATATVASCSTPSPPASADVPSGSRKKGLGLSTKTPGWTGKLADLRCRWFYTWNSAIPADLPKGVEFIPMIYRHSGNAQAITAAAAAARKAGIRELLGFNEPDVKKQGNMSIEKTLEAWPLLMQTGMRLGSPGCVHPDREWMTAFMAGVKERNLRVDFVCVHSYGGPSPEALVRRLEKVHQMFERPIWITEFAVGDWEAASPGANRHKPETVLRFMEKVLPMLDRLDFVERYAWFPAKPASIPLGTSALFNEAGALTRLGECYRDT